MSFTAANIKSSIFFVQFWYDLLICFKSWTVKGVNSGAVVIKHSMLPQVLLLHKHNYSNLSCLHACISAVSPLVQSEVCNVATFLSAQSNASILYFFPLLLCLVRLKSAKYQPEYLTSVSHFKRTTAETTFGLQVD